MSSAGRFAASYCRGSRQCGATHGKYTGLRTSQHGRAVYFYFVVCFSSLAWYHLVRPLTANGADASVGGSAGTWQALASVLCPLRDVLIVGDDREDTASEAQRTRYIHAGNASDRYRRFV